MIKIYGTRQSRAFRCLWALEECQLPYELVEVDWQKGETRAPGFLALNPSGHVPVFEHDDLVLVESLSINLHISKLVKSDLSPMTALEWMMAVQWTVWAMGELEGPHDAANRLNTHVDDEVRKGALGVLDQHLAANQFLLGDRFTIADLNVASVLMRPRYLPHVPEYSH
ncbi:MAG: glutathione S-transferase, partial [Pseudomonadota bacterium]